MAPRAVKRRRVHTLPAPRGIAWQAIEQPGEMLEAAWEAGEEGFFEDSELAITVDWSHAPRGHLVAGLTVQEPIAKTRTVDLHVLDLESYVGTVRFALVAQDGAVLAEAPRKVQRRKLASDTELAELERHWALSHLPVDASTARRVFDQAGLEVGSPQPAQWAMMVRDLLRPLETGTRKIHRQPRHALQASHTTLSVTQLRRPGLAPALAALRGQRHVEATAPQWLLDLGAAAMAAQDARRILQHLKGLREELAEVASTLDPELDHRFRRIEAHLAAIAKRGPRGRGAQQPRQAVLHDGRYRFLHRAGLLARRSVTTREGPVKAFRPPTYQLYEEWCAWALVEELADPRDWPRIRAALAHPGTRREVVLRREPRGLRMTAQYEMSIQAWKHVPDLVLRLESDDLVVLFDVKYRGEGPMLVEVPGDAIAELHRYRDAFLVTHPRARHKEIWAAVLHPAPGWNDGAWGPSRAYEAAKDRRYRVGAVPLAPRMREGIRVYLQLLGLTN